MSDFTSSLYLGLRHASRSLEPWAQLTTGKPAVLGTPRGAAGIARHLAALQGCESATLLPSTLHLFFDLFEMLRSDAIGLYVDAGAYPIARWAAERAAAFGVPLRRLPHFDADGARDVIDADTASILRPVILADGFCAICGRPAPLRDYLRCVVPRRGYVVLDDTQALGIWGAHPSRCDPYGKGGGGSLRRAEVRSPNIIIGSSLAKGFGVPLAVLGGSALLVDRFERHSKTRVHASPPSLAVLSAARNALSINVRHGDALRRRLAQRVSEFRCLVRGMGLWPPHTLFPVQGIVLGQDIDLLRVQRELAMAGVDTAVVRGCAGSDDRLVYVLNVRHGDADIRRSTAALGAALDCASARRDRRLILKHLAHCPSSRAATSRKSRRRSARC
jgi:8-amino-7-oxononanoate synthase